MSSKKDRSVSDALKSLQQKNVKFVLSQFVDINGVPKAKMVPVSEF